MLNTVEKGYGLVTSSIKELNSLINAESTVSCTVKELHRRIIRLSLKYLVVSQRAKKGELMEELLQQFYDSIRTHCAIQESIRELIKKIHEDNRNLREDLNDLDGIQKKYMAIYNKE